jgi:trans-2,3-dihydro-3-hydroxyanthranilate isomerase
MLSYDIVSSQVEMHKRYVTADVFTDRIFGGNPLAVVLDGEGLSTAQMQSIALEFNYSETTFVLPPDQPDHAARIRIFTPLTEVPFAGHPNIGTAFVLAREPRFIGRARAECLVFEEAIGLVSVSILREGDQIVGAELCAPQALSRHSIVPCDVVAACLSLHPRDVQAGVHKPQVASVGLPFLLVEVSSRDALARSKANLTACSEVLPLDGADAVFAYWRESRDPSTSESTVLHARMFSPLDRIGEDPATGSAAAATISLLTMLTVENRPERFFRIHQGVDMGRPSLICGRTAVLDGEPMRTYVGGRCVPVFEGTIPSAILLFGAEFTACLGGVRDLKGPAGNLSNSSSKPLQSR